MNTWFSNKWIIIASCILLFGIVLAFLFGSDGKPSSAWIQTAAAVALITVTWRYVELTKETLIELKKSRQESEKASRELEKARLESLKPIIVLRSREYEHEEGFTTSETFLLNVGSGTAVRITYASSIVEPLNTDITSRRNEDHPRISNCFQGRTRKLNDALNPCFGVFDSRITLTEVNRNFEGFPPLENGDFGCIVLYEDIIGRGYCTLFICRAHYFSDIYSSDIDSEEKRKIRSVISKFGGTADIATIIRDNEIDFWDAIVKQQNSSS